MLPVRPRQLPSELPYDDTDAESPAPGTSPFQGLRYFDEGDEDRFFGRERLVARLFKRLQTDRFLALVGASGSGKSSVLRAGLVPTLRAASSANRQRRLTARLRLGIATQLALGFAAVAAGSCAGQYPRLARCCADLGRWLPRHRRALSSLLAARHGFTIHVAGAVNVHIAHLMG